MSYIITQENRNNLVRRGLVRLIEFGLFYVRNMFFSVAVLFIFFVYAVTLIFLQDTLSENLFTISEVYKALHVPENIHMDEVAIVALFFKISLYFTILTEVVRYIRIRFFHKTYTLSRKKLWRRIGVSLAGISVSYIFAGTYVVLSSAEDAQKILFVFVVFWIICCGATAAFLMIDFLIKATQKKLAKWAAASV